MEDMCGLRSALQAFFHTGLGDIVQHRGDWSRAFGAAAFASGSHIYLPAKPNPSPEAERELLGHEIAHAVQQRQGRVRPTCTLAGFPLTDRIALFHLLDGAASETSLNPAMQKEAAQFAVERAQNVPEFVDYYHFCLATSLDPAPVANAARRIHPAQATAEATEPLLYSRIACLPVQGVPTPQQVRATMEDCVASGKQIGFRRLSQALAHVTQFAALQGATGPAAAKAIEQYFTQAQALLTQALAASVELSQDGTEYRYNYQSNQSKAQLSLASDGSLSLLTYQPEMP